MVVTQGGMHTGLLREIEGFPFPDRGVMKLDENVTFEFMGAVTDTGTQIQRNTTSGSKYLFILTGEVR